MTTTKSSIIIKRIALVCLCFVFALSLFSFVGCTKTKKYPENAIVISSYEELKSFLDSYAENDMIDSAVAEEGKYVVISKDIDCGGKALTPLLSADAYGLFFKFDGDGHTISNFTLDESCIRHVGTAPGTSSGTFAVLSLFPRVEGGEISNITFKDVKVELNNYNIGAEENAIRIGIVGYSKSSGSNESGMTDYTSSTYRNINIENMSVEVSTANASVAKGFVFAIGSLIGLDADTTQFGEYLEATTPKAIREDIKVSNFTVNVDVVGGPVFVGGIAGQVNWEIVSYKNCSVSGKVDIANQGTDLGSYVKYSLGSVVSVGGIVGGSLKTQHYIEVLNCKTDVDYAITSENPQELVNVGKYLGVVLVSGAESTNLAVLTLTDNTDSSSLTINNEQETIDNDYISR